MNTSTSDSNDNTGMFDHLFATKHSQQNLHTTQTLILFLMYNTAGITKLYLNYTTIILVNVLIFGDNIA